MVRVAKPALALRSFVRYYVHLEGRLSTPVVMLPVPARTAAGLEFVFGDPFEAWSGDLASHETVHAMTVIGAQTYRRVQLALQGHVENFLIMFQPGGLSRLFSVPADALTNQHFEAGAVLGRSVERLRSRLGESSSFAERIRAADRYLLRRPVVRTWHRGVTAAAGLLLRSRGTLRISSMADSAGLSVRQFERRFVSEIGVSPRLYARVARFEMALESKLRSPGVRWVDIAHDLGYHDQMHMVHDFQELSGSAPTDVAPRVELFTAIEIGGAGPRAEAAALERR
ncbi:MAG: helix-turn-helix domain-containing protein [Acidobacteriota bacterium]